MAIHLKFSYSNMLIMENIGNFPEKYDENFRKFSGKKYEIFPDSFPFYKHLEQSPQQLSLNSS